MINYFEHAMDPTEDYSEPGGIQSIFVGYLKELFGDADGLLLMGTGDDNKNPFSPYIMYQFHIKLFQPLRLRGGNVFVYDDRVRLVTTEKTPREIMVEFSDPDSFDKLEKFIKSF